MRTVCRRMISTKQEVYSKDGVMYIEMSEFLSLICSVVRANGPFGHCAAWYGVTDGRASVKNDRGL